MSEESITEFSEVIKAVVRLAKEKPNQTAEDLYFDRMGYPCCIFGHAFASLGFTEEDIDDASNGDDYGIGSLDLDSIGIRRIQPSQMQWAANVQGNQDRGNSWAVAVASAGPVPA